MWQSTPRLSSAALQAFPLCHLLSRCEKDRAYIRRFGLSAQSGTDTRAFEIKPEQEGNQNMPDWADDILLS
jgi:hypothetical protein